MKLLHVMAVVKWVKSSFLNCYVFFFFYVETFTLSNQPHSFWLGAKQSIYQSVSKWKLKVQFSAKQKFKKKKKLLHVTSIGVMFIL